MPEQVVVNSIELARNGASLSGRIAVEKLSRLQDLLSSNDGMLEYSLTGKQGDNGRLYLVCVVKGVLHIRCQRCLDALDYPVSLESELELAEGEPSLTVLVNEEDLADAIPADTELDVLALVEDEVLLDLPIAPMHASDDCKAIRNLGQSKLGEQNAFSALAALKSQGLRK